MQCKREKQQVKSEETGGSLIIYALIVDISLIYYIRFVIDGL